MKHRGWRSHALCAFVFALMTPVAALAAPAAEFPVTDQQMQALGVRLLPLAGATASGQAMLPAKVVLPTSSEFVVSAPLAGLISQVQVEPGQLVVKGQPLLRLDSPDLARLQLELLQAHNQATLADQTLRREQALFKEGIIAERRWQEADNAQRNAAAVLSQARAALMAGGIAPAVIARIIRTGKPETSLSLTAPTPGVVTAISARPGQQVEPANPLLTLVSSARLWLEITASATQAKWIKAGDRIKIAGQSATARIVSINPVVGSGQSVTVRAKLEADATTLRAGELVQVSLPLPGAAGAWDVPLTAIARQGDQAYVFVRTARGFVARAVTIVASAGQQVRVQGALTTGEQLAIASVVTLKAAWLGESGGE